MSCTPESKGAGGEGPALLVVFSSSSELLALEACLLKEAGRAFPADGTGFVQYLLHPFVKVFERRSYLAHSPGVGAEVAGMKSDKRAKPSGRGAQVWKDFLLPQTKDGACQTSGYL